MVQRCFEFDSRLPIIECRSSTAVLEDVLGKGWENHVDGKNLKQEGDAFARKTLGSDG